MKKLLVSAVSVAALAAPAMAQEFVPAEYENSAMVEQIGTANSTIVNQRWGGTINEQGLAEVTQEGSHNSATVRQRGFGSKNDSEFDSEVTITQVTNYATAVSEQVHDHDSEGPNLAFINQFSTGAWALLRQRGDSNDAGINQTEDSVDAYATLDQNGVGNYARIEQSSLGGTTSVQQGTYVGAGSPHGSDSRDNTATVVTSGMNPTITVTQYAQGNNASIVENGINAQTTVNTSSFFNEVMVDQYGENGVISINQIGSGGLNTATVWQDVTDFGSTAIINQSGAGGSSEITQRDTDDLGGSNIAFSSQSGTNWGNDGIESIILQDGASNYANVSQAAPVAVSTVDQVGTSHSASVSQ